METVKAAAFSQGEKKFNLIFIQVILLVFMNGCDCSSVQKESLQLNCSDVKENGFYKISTPSSFDKRWRVSDLSEESWVSNDKNIALILFHSVAPEPNFTEEVVRVSPGEIILRQCRNVTRTVFFNEGLEIRIDFILVPEETPSVKGVGGETRKRTGLVMGGILVIIIIAGCVCFQLKRIWINKIKLEMQHATNV
ncbi:uncharacterized protein LOC121312131 isoform X1 [Polyodon spathula]|uniref:uncharacterized protein LOC121312131 isoform X1 n=1 Tax=Polyodon spathula TaxID=7913 RepID=UPI001B7E675D|nr:uncharacterized protein LOC121312131 isoform X1 [Polyodon spathula]